MTFNQLPVPIQGLKQILHTICPRRGVYFGCIHYQSNALLYAECCNVFVPCRHCHNEQYSSKDDLNELHWDTHQVKIFEKEPKHKLNQQKLSTMLCIICVENSIHHLLERCDENEITIMHNEKYRQLLTTLPSQPLDPKICSLLNVYPQPISQHCNTCTHPMASYYCQPCGILTSDTDINDGTIINIHDQIYHCNSCKVCHLGRQDEYRHCPDCRLCSDAESFDSYHSPTTCFVKEKKQCVICLYDEDDDTDNDSEGDNPIDKNVFQILPCSHILHARCFRRYEKLGKTSCPSCRKDFAEYQTWEIDDSSNELNPSPLPSPKKK